jgi:hypothetical protein
VDLWNQWVTAGIWLQNIDSRDFACKFFGMKNLRATKADPYDLQQEKQRQKQTKARQTRQSTKRLRVAQPGLGNSLFQLYRFGKN